MIPCVDCPVNRAIRAIFGDLKSQKKGVDPEGTSDCEVTLSFLQIYRETIQDLLSPWSLEVRSHLLQFSMGRPAYAAWISIRQGIEPDNRLDQENLPVREDPHRGV
jgi:hypothetical protein